MVLKLFKHHFLCPGVAPVNEVGRHLKIVEGLGIVVEDSVLGFSVDVGLSLQYQYRVQLTGGVGVPVVGADHDAIVARVFDDIGQVIVALAGNEYLVFSEWVLGEPFALSLRTPGDFVVHPGYPLS